MPFIPHTEQDVQAMLGAIGADSIEALFDEIFKYTEQRKVFQLIESLTPDKLPKEVVEKEEKFIKEIQELENRLAKH